MLLKCLFNNFSKQLSIKTSSIIRTKIHPTPSKVKKVTYFILRINKKLLDFRFINYLYFH